MEKIFVSIRGEIISKQFDPEAIFIEEYHVTGRQLFTDEPNLLIDETLSKQYDIIDWLEQFNEENTTKYEEPIYAIKLTMSSTLNDVFDDVYLYEKYVKKDIISIEGTLTRNKQGRVKIGNRILYNWFVTETQRFKKGSQPCDYVYIEITIQPKRKETTSDG